MQILPGIETNYNIYEKGSSTLTIEQPVFTKPVWTPVVPPPGGSQIGEKNALAMAETAKQWSEEGFENFKKTSQQVNEFFYGEDDTLDYTPGNDSLSVEIAKATQLGYALIIDGKLSPTVHFSKNKDLHENLSYSPMYFQKQVDNLRSLYLSYGDGAKEHEAVFTDALNRIADQLIQTGGRYISADPNGIRESLSAMLHGEEGKYSREDMTSMLIASHHSSVASVGQVDNEYRLGMELGYSAVVITALKRNGKLSENAYRTMWDRFEKYVQERMEAVNKRIKQAEMEPYSSKKYTYTPLNNKLVQEAIGYMLRSLDQKDFNTGIRQAIDKIGKRYEDHRMYGRETGNLELRFLFTASSNIAGDKKYGNYAYALSSKYLSDYMGDPGFALKGDLFAKVDVAV
jgi:hypothetical protein